MSKKQKPQKSTWVFLGLFLVLVAVGFFMRSSFFTVQSILIEAASLETKQLVEKTLSDVKGKNIWELEMDEMSSLITNKTLGIRSVFFQRHWPATLRVKVEERKAVAQTFIEGDMWVMDGEGITFKKKLEAIPLFWPLPNNRRNFQEALAWLESDHPPGVNGLTWNKELGLILLFDRKIKIIMGRGNYPANWKKARETLDYLKSKNLETKRIDATYNNRAVVSL